MCESVRTQGHKLATWQQAHTHTHTYLGVSWLGSVLHLFTTWQLDKAWLLKQQQISKKTKISCFGGFNYHSIRQMEALYVVAVEWMTRLPDCTALFYFYLFHIYFSLFSAGTLLLNMWRKIHVYFGSRILQNNNQPYIKLFSVLWGYSDIFYVWASNVIQFIATMKDWSLGELTRSSINQAWKWGEMKGLQLYLNKNKSILKYVDYNIWYWNLAVWYYRGVNRQFSNIYGKANMLLRNLRSWSTN